MRELHDELISSGAMPVREADVFGPRWSEIEGRLRRRPVPWWHGRRDELLALLGDVSTEPHGFTPRFPARPIRIGDLLAED